MIVTVGECRMCHVFSEILDEDMGTEPGYYADDRYGIRIENALVIRDTQTSEIFGKTGFLGFEHITMVRSSSPLPASS